MPGMKLLPQAKARATYPMAYLRGLYDLPFTGATVGSGTLYLPERGLLEEERLAPTSLAERIAGWSGGKRVILLSQIGPLPRGEAPRVPLPGLGEQVRTRFDTTL
jgi:hypothetical protein